MTTDFPSSAVLTQEPSTFERSFASGFDVDANSAMVKSCIDGRVPVAKTCSTVPCPCHSSRLASRCRHVAKDIFPDRANRVHRSTGTSCSSSQSMGINGLMRQETREVWRHHRLFTHSCGMCTQRSKDQSESKNEGQCHHQSQSGSDHQWRFTRRTERQRLSKVRPRASCAQNRFRTDHALSRMGPRWDAFNFREKNDNRTGDGGLPTGSGGQHAGPRTNTLPGQDSSSQNPTLSNDWTAQMQVLMSNPALTQEQFAQ